MLEFKQFEIQFFFNVRYYSSGLKTTVFGNVIPHYHYDKSENVKQFNSVILKVIKFNTSILKNKEL